MRTIRSDNVTIPQSFTRGGFHTGSHLGLADSSSFAYSPPGVLTRCDAKDLSLSILSTSFTNGSNAKRRVKERCPVCTALTRIMCSKCVSNRVRCSSHYVNYKIANERNEKLYAKFEKEVSEEQNVRAKIIDVQARILDMKQRSELLELKLKEKRRTTDRLRQELTKGQHVWKQLAERERAIVDRLAERPRMTQEIVDDRRLQLITKRKKLAGQLFVWIFPLVKIDQQDFETMLQTVQEKRQNSWQLINSDDPYGTAPNADEKDKFYSICECVINEHFSFESLHRSLTPRDALALDRTNCHVFAGLHFLAQLVQPLVLLFAIPIPVELSPKDLFKRTTFTKSQLSSFLLNLKIAIILICVSQAVPVELLDLSTPLRNLSHLYEKICDDMSQEKPTIATQLRDVPLALTDKLKMEINNQQSALTSADSSDIVVLEDWVAL